MDLAAVCDMTVTCTCGLKELEVDKWVRMSLMGGLNDVAGGDIQGGQDAPC